MEQEELDLENVQIEKMLKGLSTLQDERKARNQNYQEFQLQGIEAVKRNFMNAIHRLYQQGVESKLLNNIIKNHGKYFSCLLAYCEMIMSVIEESSLFTFSHKNFVSQSALLAFFLAKQTKAKVALVVAEESLLHMGHLIAGEAEEDKITFTRSALQKEGVALHDLKEWRKEGLDFGDALVVVDVFGLNPTEYAPFLLKNFAGLSSARKAFVYHSHLQNEEVGQLLNQVSADAFPLQLWPDYPLEFIAEKEEKRLVEQLIEFLREDLNHPEKQDVVIFYPIDQHVKRYSAKLAEQFSKAGLKDLVSIIVKPHERHLRSKSNIFIVQDTSQLLHWNYDYSNVLYVIDYGKQSRLTFNYSLCAYAEQTTSVCSSEKAKRHSLIGNNQFGIYSSLVGIEIQKNSYLETVQDISGYLLKMIDYNLSSFLDQGNERVRSCLALLEKLQLIKHEAGLYSIIDEGVIPFARQGISPLQYKFIHSIATSTSIQKASLEKFLNLAIYMSVFLHTKAHIRKEKQQSDVFIKSKPTEIWRKSGYIESCIAVLAKCETTEIELARESESGSFRRNSSKMQESQTDPFGSLYQLIDDPTGGQSSERVSIPTFLQQNSIDEQIFYLIRESVDHYRQVFNVPKTSIIFEKDDFNAILREYLNVFKESLLFYTGYLRKGYQSQSIKFENDYVQINNESLKREYYLKPLFISALRYQVQGKTQEILIWNTVPETMYLEVLGSLPIIEKMSKAEAEVEFHGISSLLFQKLWRNNGVEIYRFEEENNCLVEPNHEVALLIIHCDKQKSEEVKGKFETIINKLKETISASNRLTHYLGNIKFYLGAGGSVKEMVIGDYVNKGLLENLHLEATKEDLEELIEEFIVIRDIQIRLPEPGKFTKSAVVFFNSQRDFYRFYDYFNDCEYLGHTLKVTSIKKSKLDFAWEKQYIEFKWYVWQTHNKALIRFASEEGAKAALEAFKANPELDGVKVEVAIEGKNVTIDQLNDITDEIFIDEALRNYGAIEEVQILKTPLREAITQNLELESLIVGTIQNKQFQMQSIERGRSGLRTCIVNFENYDDLMKVVSTHNKTVSNLGESRLYTVSHFERSLQISDSLRNVALSILEEVFDQLQGLNIIKQGILKYDVLGEQIVFHSFSKSVLDQTYNMVSMRMKGGNIKLKKSKKSLVFNEIGLANLLDLEEKYNCKLIINVATQTLTAICRHKLLDAVSKEITIRILNSFFYKIFLNTKSYNYFKLHPEKLVEIKDKYKLKLAELELDQQSIIIEGNIVNVQTANIYFMYFIESLNKPEEERVHSDVCGICCEEPKQSYRLQSCFHRFCVQCMQQYIRNALGDRSQFPLKCPHCNQLIIVQDLALILDKTQWQKAQTLAINQFVADNSDKMTFCYTAGCKEINIINGLVWSCKVCNFTYCNKCKEVTHAGYSCDQAIEIRQTDVYFLKYMAENGIRKCPNAACKMPVVKIDGCNKVLCSRCGKSMCFKCKPEQMIAYETPTQAYAHLNEKHGGYW